jgi:N-succinyldiaminopimelate aminotransferase
MNPLLSKLQPYPFERLKALTQGVTPNTAYRAISLGIGEPKHPTPQFIKDALSASLDGLASYPATAGEPALRQACARWMQRRYGLSLNVDTQILPVNGSREALFALAQTVIDPAQHQAAGGPTVVSPNPFYQIYEGAALLSGARVVYANSDPARNFAADWGSIPDEVWATTQLLFASDECYSEIYFREGPEAAPLGGLQAAAALGRHDFKRLIMLTSLSKRSNVPGMRSGFVAGDAEIIKAFLLYRTYHGSAMGPAIQRASVAAWEDEAHVIENRRLYREKFEQVTPILASVLDVALPDASFYLWAQVPTLPSSAQNSGLSSDEWFARELLAQYNVAVLPGSYLARQAQGINPGTGRIRMALVAGVQECVEAAERIKAFTQGLN